MFSLYLISTPTSALLDAKNIISITYTDLTTEPSLFHKHNETEILLPVGGKGTLLTQYHQTSFEPCNLYIVNPQTSHTEKTDSTLKYYVIKLKNVSLPNNLQHFISVKLKQDEYERLKDFLSNAVTELQKKDKYSDKIAYFYLANFYQYSKRILSNLDHKFTTTKNKIATPELISEIKQYIEKNYGLELKISQICKHFLITPNNLAITFKKEIGCSPQQYLLQTRIKAAKYLLSTADLTISQISSVCGFNSPAHFTEIFRKYENMTPKKYREMSK